MKRALPGKKRKLAPPARKPAAKRPAVRLKTKLKNAARTPSAGKKPTVSPKLKRAKSKPAQPKPRPRKILKRKPAKRPPGKRAAKKKLQSPRLTVPAFLLEGDEPSPATAGGPGEKFSLGPTAPLDHFAEAAALPESYGTGRLFLTARDPHLLYAHWDFTREEQFRHNARSVDRHLILRVHDLTETGPRVSEIHVHPESQHWFAHVPHAGKKYFAELGYYRVGRKWKSLATSAPQCTPPNNISANSTVAFATIPLELSFETMLALLKENPAARSGQNLSLARALEKIHAPPPSFPEAPPPADWTAEQEQALAKILAADRAGLALPGSEEFTAENAWPKFLFDFETGEAASITAPSSYLSSYLGGAGGILPAETL